MEDVSQELVEEVQSQWPGFTVTCDKCESKLVYLANDIGFSPESGGWGGISFQCTKCDNSVEFYANYY